MSDGSRRQGVAVSRIQTRSVTIAMVAVVALLAAACGGDDDDGEGATVTTGGEATEAIETATTPPTTAESTDASSEAGTTAAEESATTALAADEDLDLEATIRITTAAPGVSLDPHRERQSGDRDYTNLLYDRLTIITTDQSVAPMLAESWEFSDDGKALTLTLRDDATFQDGTPIDAAAVKANLERAQTLPDGTVAVLPRQRQQHRGGGRQDRGPHDHRGRCRPSGDPRHQRRHDRQPEGLHRRARSRPGSRRRRLRSVRDRRVRAQ